MNFVAKGCQPPGILGDFAVDRWKFIDFTRPGILRPSSCTDKKWNSPMLSNKETLLSLYYNAILIKLNLDEHPWANIRLNLEGHYLLQPLSLFLVK